MIYHENEKDLLVAIISWAYKDLLKDLQSLLCLSSLATPNENVLARRKKLTTRMKFEDNTDKTKAYKDDIKSILKFFRGEGYKQWEFETPGEAYIQKALSTAQEWAGTRLRWDEIMNITYYGGDI